MTYEKLEPHGRMTIAGAEFSWEFYVLSAQLNNDDRGNVVISPMLIQYQMVFMANMASGETKKKLLTAMRMKPDDDAEELMRWMLWCYDYFLREVALSYGTKPRSALVVARGSPFKYEESITNWINHYRARKSYHVIPTLKGAEKQLSATLRRLTGAYPQDAGFDEIFPPNLFDAQTKAVIASQLYFQFFLPSCACLTKVSESNVAFWRQPTDESEKQGEERLLRVRTLKLLKKIEYLDEELFEMVGLDLYPANLSVYFLLPKEIMEDQQLPNVNQSMQNLKDQLDGHKLHLLMQKLLPQRTKRTIDMMMTFPCFKIVTTGLMEQAMCNMGLGCLFDPKNLDWTNLFTDMDPNGGDFYLSAVKQDIVIQMLPTSTSSNFYLKPLPASLKFPENYTGRQIIFNRPFLFFVYDHFSRAFLIHGHIQNPCSRWESMAT